MLLTFAVAVNNTNDGYNLAPLINTVYERVRLEADSLTVLKALYICYDCSEYETKISYAFWLVQREEMLAYVLLEKYSSTNSSNLH